MVECAIGAVPLCPVGVEFAKIGNCGVVVACKTGVHIITMPPIPGVRYGRIDFGGFYLVCRMAPSTGNRVDDEVDRREQESPLGECSVG